MLFSSAVFIFLFLPLLIVFYFWAGKGSIKVKNFILLIFSLLFYTWGEGFLVLIMLAVVLINYIAGILIEKTTGTKRKLTLIISIILTLSFLFFFKYLNFTSNIICGIFNLDNKVPKIILPIGISFYIFQTLSYTIDVYRKEVACQKNFFYLFLYVSLFPQLIAGPIVRYKSIAEQIEYREENLLDIYDGIHRFIIGLAKKVILSNNVAFLADLIFNNGANETVLAWVGAIAYTFQIYFDFSGYSDMAIGLGKIFGFSFSENFNYPYTSKNISEFWRRWHISLGTWFRDYVYFPLGGSRVKSKTRLIFNLFVVWLLTGLWHGANWTFILWGLYNLIFIIIDKLTDKKKEHSKIFDIFRTFVTFIIVVIGWVIFRANNINDALNYIKMMFSFDFKNITKTFTLLNDYVLCFCITSFNDCKRQT